MSIKVTYSDNTTATITPTLFDTIAAEKYVMATYGSEGQIALNSYSVYAALRRTGQTAPGESFEDWARRVTFTEAMNAGNAGKHEAASEEDTDPLPPVGLTAASAV